MALNCWKNILFFSFCLHFATVSKKNKKKKNKNRFAEDEEPRSDFLRDLDSSAKSSSSLLSAADLIFGADIAVPSASSAGAAMMNNSIRIEKSHDRENVEPNSGDDSSGSSWSKVEAREQKNAAGISKKMEAKGNGAIPGLKFEVNYAFF